MNITTRRQHCQSPLGVRKPNDRISPSPSACSPNTQRAARSTSRYIPARYDLGWTVSRSAKEIVPKDAFSPAAQTTRNIRWWFVLCARPDVYMFSSSRERPFCFQRVAAYSGGGSFLATIRIKWKTGRPGTLSNFRYHRHRRRHHRCRTTADAIVLKPKTFIIVWRSLKRDEIINPNVRA